MDALVLWAKWRKGEPGSYHPLLCHLCDVAAVTIELWESVLSPWTRAAMATDLGPGEEAAGHWIAYLSGLHDIGKASPAFQLKVEAARPRLENAGLPVNAKPGDVPHGTVSTAVLGRLLAERHRFDPALAERIAVIVGGHHGVFPTAHAVSSAYAAAIGKLRWREARGDLAAKLAELVGVPEEPPRALGNAGAMKLAGLVSVADWIGSNEEFFPHLARDAGTVPTAEMPEYWSGAREKARRALRELGWDAWKPDAGRRTFGELFPELGEQRPLQKAAVGLSEGVPGPGLVVVEAPMGEGKTEAAFYLADRWGVDLGQRGVYFALPTQATSNQMHERAAGFLRSRYPGEVVNLQLVHGQSALRQSDGEIFQPGELYDESQGADGAPARVVAAEWFLNRKRALLAPFGVGTVDQALLAALQTRHGFVRLFGLAGKTVIIDEVHAYDAYMTTLLARLLEWLGALGSPVALLSATLPRRRREDLIRAYAEGAGWDVPAELPPAPYPRLSWAAADGAGARAVEATPERSRDLHVEWVDGRLPADGAGEFALGQRLRDVLAGGGCAAVVCNTVARAQRVYTALKPYFPETADDGAPELDLLHARFLAEDREEREKRVLRRFGHLAKGRPRRAVLVATQVIEQSLDIDFDLLASDHAPADLLLQRAGRMHRHYDVRPADSRPPGLDRARLWVCAPERMEGGVPRFDRGSKAVYEPHVLLRSWLELRDRGAIRLPGDIEGIVEAVYDDDRPCPENVEDDLRTAWEETRGDYLHGRESEQQQARLRYIKRPGYDGSVALLMGEPREEDAPELHPSHQALTRLIEQTVSLVCLHGVPEEPSLAEGPVDMNRKPGTDLARRLLRRGVTVADKRVVHDLLREPVPKMWRESPLLCHRRLVVLDEDGTARAGNVRLRLDSELGLLVES